MLINQSGEVMKLAFIFGLILLQHLNLFLYSNNFQTGLLKALSQESYILDNFVVYVIGYTFKFSYIFDFEGKITTKLKEVLKNGFWLKNLLTTYIYNSEGKLFTELNEVWRVDKWVNYYRITNYYDFKGNTLETLYETMSSNIWINDYRYTWTYDNDGKKLSEVAQNWKNKVVCLNSLVQK